MSFVCACCLTSCGPAASGGLDVYADPGATAYDAQHRTHVIRRLRQRAENLGFSLIDLSTGEVMERSVS
jgi:hypothetical protein